jgi:hypothetical protein
MHKETFEANRVGLEMNVASLEEQMKTSIPLEMIYVEGCKNRHLELLGINDLLEKKAKPIGENENLTPKGRAEEFDKELVPTLDELIFFQNEKTHAKIIEQLEAKISNVQNFKWYELLEIRNRGADMTPEKRASWFISKTLSKIPHIKIFVAFDQDPAEDLILPAQLDLARENVFKYLYPEEFAELQQLKMLERMLQASISRIFTSFEKLLSKPNDDLI